MERAAAVLGVVLASPVLFAAAPPRHHTARTGAAPFSMPASSGSAAGFTFSDWQVSTAQFDYNWESGAFNAPGHITLTRPGSNIEADRANGNSKTKQATLTGDVVLHDSNGVLTSFAGPGATSHEPATLTCSLLQIDGVSKTYTATGSVHFTQGPSTVTADRAVMNGFTHDLHLYGNVHLSQ